MFRVNYFVYHRQNYLKPSEYLKMKSINRLIKFCDIYAYNNIALVMLDSAERCLQFKQICADRS